MKKSELVATIEAQANEIDRLQIVIKQRETTIMHLNRITVMDDGR
jgi:ABC-type multidrug transport system fused ATPase/permease subunit